jgi:hypothetical protein
MLIAISRINVPVDSPPGPTCDPLEPAVAVAGPLAGEVGGGVEPDRLTGGGEDAWVEPTDVGGSDGVALDDVPGPDAVPVDVEIPEPPELGACEIGPEPCEPDTEPELGGRPGKVVVQLSDALVHGGGGGYGAVGVAAAVATTLPSRNIRPATRNPADPARPIGRLRP